ncbi:MAG: tetraacyldisaccharide 4'-kinase [Methylobacteriaceae bacterium]|jgi:tetraacyldisaccharide 4'-kinase|nr:tetraacyldisaccharide 4'-kinase [Methylobacteriaceae bacterium]
MRAPAFWWTSPPSPAARLLAPLAVLYGCVAKARLAKTGERAALPVLCVGNFIAGGAGKTPTALFAARALTARGRHPVFLSRGYGGTLARRKNAPVVVDPAIHTVRDVGDEPLLLADVAPTVVDPLRPRGARLCADLGDVIIMDDGMQNPALVKDLTLAVMDSRGVGNALCLPAGPLRAPLAAQARIADALLLIDAGDIALHPALRDLPVFHASFSPAAAAAAAVKNQRILAFSGIGEPAKFYRTLKNCGADLVKTVDFPDHHAFRPSEIESLVAEARALAVPVYTTEKDHVRLSGSAAAAVRPFPVTLQAADERAFAECLEGVFAGKNH